MTAGEFEQWLQDSRAGYTGTLEEWRMDWGSQQAPPGMGLDLAREVLAWSGSSSRACRPARCFVVFTALGSLSLSPESLSVHLSTARHGRSIQLACCCTACLQASRGQQEV